jgi:hypothetical protein
VGNLAIVETILRDRRAFFDEVRQGKELEAKMRAMLVSCLAFFALYGAVMGSSHSLWQALSSAGKLPLLFLATLLVCAPTLYFFNLIFGSNQSLSQSIVLMLSGITVTAVLLLSFAPVVLFFLLTTSHYQFFKLLNVGVFTVSGGVGVAFLSHGMRIVSRASQSGAGARGLVTYAWIVLYGFVGSQMAWTLRPFIGAPSITEFELFRELGGNFYANVLASLGEILGFFLVR